MREGLTCRMASEQLESESCIAAETRGSEPCGYPAVLGLASHDTSSLHTCNNNHTRIKAKGSKTPAVVYHDLKSLLLLV